ncbi:MAG TPA: Gfo/Idh/MocA family oxidoreductase [bacterium]|nr:Gfo/Idh/MocA family oxidoreductase [bacterium]HPN44901.1 Gfo/Idh/MocA family oxidoreductase [bacterium]
MRSAVIGCGNISRFHFHAIMTNPLTELAAICDVNPELAKRKAEELGGVKFYTRVDELLKNEKIDALHVLTPPHLHKEVALPALEKGIHVLIEKPVALTVKDVEVMNKAAEKSGARLGVNHNMLYDPTYRRARDIANSFAFGDLLHAEVFFGFDTRRVIGANGLEGTWLKEMKGHFLQDLFPHPAAIIFDLLQNINTTHIIKKNPGGDNILKEEVRILFDAQNATAAINMSLSVKPDIFTLVLYGTKMIARVDLSNMSIVKQKTWRRIPKAFARGVDSISQSMQMFGNTICVTAGVALKRISPTAGMTNLINAFYTSLDKDWPLPVSGQDALKVIELSEKIWK